MTGPVSDWVRGQTPPCPVRFNAAAYCVGASDIRDPAKIAMTAVGDGQTTWSFADVEQAVARAAGALLAAGVDSGDRVLILLGDSPVFPFAYFGAMAAGAIATPLSAQLTSSELQAIVDVTQPRVILSCEPLEIKAPGAQVLGPEALAAGDPVPFAETRAEDPAQLVFTSGSSGAPKGVLHAHRAIWARKSMHAGWHGIGADDRVMHAGAFNWTYTLGVGLADVWGVGATAILNAGPRDAAIWPKLAAAHRPSVFAAAPGVYRRILKYGTGLEDAFASLRHAVTAGEFLAPSIAADWTRRTGKPILEALGMSEVSTYVSTPPDRTPVPGHAGWPQPGRRVAVVKNGAPMPVGQTGQLAVHKSDPGLFLGYWRDGARTKAAYVGDWFLTGDLAVMREDGALAYQGRKDDQMNAQGYRVDPGEVEAVLLQHPGVEDCGVAELPLADGLSVIAAWVVGAGVSVEALQAHAELHLARYKCPREFVFVARLPRSANGKLLRRELAK